MPVEPKILPTQELPQAASAGKVSVVWAGHASSSATPSTRLNLALLTGMEGTDYPDYSNLWLDGISDCCNYENHLSWFTSVSPSKRCDTSFKYTTTVLFHTFSNMWFIQSPCHCTLHNLYI
jgi:hypothetical protein